VKWSAKSAKKELPYKDSIQEALPRVYYSFTSILNASIQTICKISDRDQKRFQPEDTSSIATSLQNLAIAASGLHRLYEGPGQGRHDNDHQHIKDISIEPTHGELLADKVTSSEIGSCGSR
jgi:hypothetical protein